MAIRATIDERQFRELVSGKAVLLKPSGNWGFTMEVSLNDIGFARMVVAVQDAMDEAKVTPFDEPSPPPDPPPPLAA